MTITDTPPAGVTVLSFEVTVNGAVLNPGNVQLLSKPAQIEVRQLETESAFLSTVNVPAGTYQSITLNLTNPELTIFNQSGAAVGGCANNAVCELKPSAAGNVTYTGSPFPVTLQSGAPSGLQVDVNVANLISNSLTVDFTTSGALSVAQLPLPGQPMNHLDDLDDLTGTVQSLDGTNKTFTLHTTTTDYPIQTDANTEYDFETCAANDFTCLQANQVVNVDAKMLAGGAFLAKEIGFEDNAMDDELEGVIYKIDGPAQFEMVVLDELRPINNVSVGNPVVVTLDGTCSQSACFHVQAEELKSAVPGILQNAFDSAADTSQLLPGQAVEVRLMAPVTPATATTLASASTNRVRLRMTQFTANVKAGSIVPPNFSVDNLPALFTGATPPIPEIHVQTSARTVFQGVSGVTGLADGNTVSLRGLLFSNGANPPELIAKKVRKR